MSNFLFNSFRSSETGAQIMAWSSGLPFDSSDRRTHTRLIACPERNNVTAEESSGATSLTRHSFCPLDVVGLHQQERILRDL